VPDVSAEQSRSLEYFSALASEQASLQRALLDALIRLCEQMEQQNATLVDLLAVLLSQNGDARDEDSVPTHDLSGAPIKVR
jgi:hypothetical protein